MISKCIYPAKSLILSLRTILSPAPSESICPRWNTIMPPYNVTGLTLVAAHTDSGLGHQTCFGQWKLMKHDRNRGLSNVYPLGKLALEAHAKLLRNSD